MTDLESRLAAYVDGELDREQTFEIERLLGKDARARQFVRVQRDMTMLLRGSFAESNYAPAPDAANRFLNLVPQRSQLRLRKMVAIAATLVVAVLSFAAGSYVGRSAQPSQMDELLEEVSAYHGVFARETDHLVEVPASRSSELAAWLGDRLGRKLNIPDLSSAGLTFAGGRMLVVNGRPVAQLLYTQPGQIPLGVCITRASDASSGLKVAKQRGLDLAWWVEGAYAYLIVGSLPGQQAKALADLVANAARG